MHPAAAAASRRRLGQQAPLAVALSAERARGHRAAGAGSATNRRCRPHGSGSSPPPCEADFRISGLPASMWTRWSREYGFEQGFPRLRKFSEVARWLATRRRPPMAGCWLLEGQRLARRDGVRVTTAFSRLLRSAGVWVREGSVRARSGDRRGGAAPPPADLPEVRLLDRGWPTRHWTRSAAPTGTSCARGEQDAARRFGRPLVAVEEAQEAHRETGCTLARTKTAGGEVWRATPSRKASAGSSNPASAIEDVAVLIDRLISRSLAAGSEPFVGSAKRSANTATGSSTRSTSGSTKAAQRRSTTRSG